MVRRRSLLFVGLLAAAQACAAEPGANAPFAWYDAADKASFVLAKDRIAVWKHKSGQGHGLIHDAAQN